MDQIQMPKITERIISVTAILVVIGTSITILMGIGSAKMNREIKVLEGFLANTESININFEKSLKVYTQGTEEIINFLSSLRPLKEEDYIKFISAIEELEQKHGLKIELKSLKQSEEQGKTLDYSLSFFANEIVLKKFLKDIELLPYFVKIDSLEFTNPKFVDSDSNNSGNVIIKIKLYIK